VRISKISIIKYWYFKWILFPVLYCNNILFLKTNINHKIFHRGHCREIGKSPLKGAENLHLGSHIASRIVLPFHIWATYRKTFQHSSIYLPQFCFCCCCGFNGGNGWFMCRSSSLQSPVHSLQSSVPESSDFSQCAMAKDNAVWNAGSGVNLRQKQVIITHWDMQKLALQRDLFLLKGFGFYSKNLCF